MKPLIAVPAIFALLYRAYSRKSLTPLGLFAAAITASIHAIHPWSVFFTLLGVFFLAGTAATKVKHGIKARLTQSASSGSSGGEGPRTHIQVLANSAVASVLILLHAYKLSTESNRARSECWAYGRDLLVVGIIANYAAVASDTFSSELGILSKSEPFLITSFPPRHVPRGTNGGITLTGLAAGALGSLAIAFTALLLTPFCDNWSWQNRVGFTAAITLVGLVGSVWDSILGGLLQASVVDVRTGKIIEGEGGRKVLITSLTDEGKDKHGQKKPSSRRLESGRDLLSNNGVNLLMAASVSVGAMVVAARAWDVPLSQVFTT
ncbi:MAG: hypothetical protein M1820_000795 [Bogoriella megaspora]|nr:MAG: hypothetical protein M1820_000795 [Bogoriella megaspora]